jgi:hypothetical protein
MEKRSWLPSERTLALVLAHAPTAMVLGQLAVFYGLVLRARLALGRWPRPNLPDPKEIDFPVHAVVTIVGGFFTVLTPVLAVILLGAARALGLPRPQLRASAVAFGLCYLAGVALYVADPGGFGEWFRD